MIRERQAALAAATRDMQGGRADHDQRAAPQRPPGSTPRRATVTDGWLRIEGGRIAETGEGPRAGGIDCNGACLAPGIVDVGVKVGERGERHKESLRTAGRAAAAGGVTTMVHPPRYRLPPSTRPRCWSSFIRRARDGLAGQGPAGWRR